MGAVGIDLVRCKACHGRGQVITPKSPSPRGCIQCSRSGLVPRKVKAKNFTCRKCEGGGCSYCNRKGNLYMDPRWAELLRALHRGALYRPGSYLESILQEMSKGDLVYSKNNWWHLTMSGQTQAQVVL